jgi:hypothetical protein
MSLTVDPNGNLRGAIGSAQTIGIDGTVATRIQAATYAGNNATIAADGRSFSIQVVAGAQLLQVFLLTTPGVFGTIHFFPFIYTGQPLNTDLDFRVLSGSGGDPYQNTIIGA